MTKLNEMWFFWFMLGFAVCFLLTALIVPRTRLIDAIPAQQECTRVTVYEQTESFCKPVEDINR
jgi:hypothetical protein